MSKNSVKTLKTRDGREFPLNTPEEEVRITAAAILDPDAQPLTDEQLARMRPAREVLSPAVYDALLRKRGRPKSNSPKVFTGIRFDVDVLAGLRATGRGWQTRVNDVMREWLKQHSA
ncbi:MAG: BrnA antitoxin family protein [Burkholderiaceae bacterium]|jgi:uncharacterized protein (DUF4415 family)|nr:BrnA antitoxin family protein [Burkholderiaceae bacterium]